MDDLSDEEYTRAVAEGERLRRTEPRAAEAHYDPRAGTVVIVLRNGCTFSFPAILGQGLETASAHDLAQVRVEGEGYGLHWEALDVDLAVPALLMGRFGNERHMRRLAARRGPKPRATRRPALPAKNDAA